MKNSWIMLSRVLLQFLVLLQFFIGSSAWCAVFAGTVHAAALPTNRLAAQRVTPPISEIEISRQHVPDKPGLLTQPNPTFNINYALTLQITPNPVQPGQRCTISGNLFPRPAKGAITYNFFINGRNLASNTSSNQIPCPNVGPGTYQISADALIRLSVDDAFNPILRKTIHATPVNFFVEDIQPPTPAKLTLQITPLPQRENDRCTIQARFDYPKRVISKQYSFFLNGKRLKSNLSDNRIPCPIFPLGRHYITATAFIQYDPDRSGTVQTDPIYFTIEKKDRPPPPPPPTPPDPQKLLLELNPFPRWETDRCTIQARLDPPRRIISANYSFFINGKRLRSNPIEHAIPCPPFTIGSHNITAVAFIQYDPDRSGTVQANPIYFTIEKRDGPTPPPPPTPPEPPPSPPPPPPPPPEGLLYLLIPLGFFTALVLYWVLKPHPSQVVAPPTSGLEARVVHSEAVTQHLAPFRQPPDAQLVLVFDKGTQTLTDQNSTEV